MTVKARPIHSLLISLLLAVLVAGGVLSIGTQAQAQQDPLPPFFIRCDIVPTLITPPATLHFIGCQTTDETGESITTPTYNCDTGTAQRLNVYREISCTQVDPRTLEVFTCFFEETLAPRQLVNIYRCGGDEGGGGGGAGGGEGGAGGGGEGGAGGGGAGGGGGGGEATPITQEGEQDSEAGEIDQSFDVS